MAPPGDPGVVAGAENGRHFEAPEVGRPGVLGVLDEPVGEGLLPRRRLVAHDLGEQPGDRFDDDEGGRLAAGQDVVADRQLAVAEVVGDPLVDALERMAHRLDVEDLTWVVQAIRIQQTVGGKLADLLHTLADFIRDREEVRREVRVLTAEGRISAYVLTALAPYMFLAIQVVSPGYMKPMFHGLGLVVLGFTALLMTFGSVIIFRMCKIEV